MPASFDLRHALAGFVRILTLILTLLVFVALTIVSLSGFLVYQIVHPARNPAAFDLNLMMGHPETFSFPVEGGGTQEGWFFPGLRGAPTVVVCHGYQSQRADVLTLVSSLQDHQFNVFLFDFPGHGANAGRTTLGYRETAELVSAIQALSTRDDVDPRHFGLWGADMGGYAVLEVASRDPRIAAFAVDNAYGDPRYMLRTEVSKSGLNAVPGVVRAADFLFRMLNYSDRLTAPVSSRLGSTRGIPKLFIASADRPALAAATQQLFTEAPDPKQMLRESVSYRDMSDDDRRNYENLITNFFLQYIPPAPR